MNTTIKPRKMTVAEVRKKFGISVPDAVGALQKEHMAAIIISATGEAQMVDWLRAVMPTKVGMIVGVITEPVTPEPVLTGQKAHAAINEARSEARLFIDRPTTETRHRLQLAIKKLENTL
jgi:hypothetical protein